MHLQQASTPGRQPAQSLLVACLTANWCSVLRNFDVVLFDSIEIIWLVALVRGIFGEKLNFGTPQEFNTASAARFMTAAKNGRRMASLILHPN